MHKGLTIDKLNIGQTYDNESLINKEMIDAYAKVTGDYNPIHVNEEYAKTSVFKSPIADGVLLAGIISKFIGMEFPGIGTIYVSQTLNFIKPVYVGDHVFFHLRVLDKQDERNRVLIETRCTNQRGDTVLTGETLVMPPL